MKIGLIDVDGHNFPNLALMKISAHYKNKGDSVNWVNAMEHYDKIYLSKVFTFTNDYITIINANEVIKGGTGYSLKTKLPEEIENQYPDYDLYNIKNTAYGYLTRGCPRNCKFCIVSEKEGLRSVKVSNLESFWNNQKEIKLLDPNILACDQHLDLLDQLSKSKAWIDFTQGFDCRFLRKENIEKILSCKIKILHFAWDDKEDETKIIKKLELFNKYCNFNMRKKRVYILTNFNTSFDYDLYRIKVLKKLNYDPYVMIYDKDKCATKYKHLQRYVNSKFIFYSAKNYNEYRAYLYSKNTSINSNQLSIF
jgi:hypothetical protein